MPASSRVERLVDLGDHVVGVLAERLIELEVDEVGGVVGEVLVAGGGVDLPHALVVGGEVAGCAHDVLAEAEQLRPALGEIDRHDVPFWADARRCSASSRVSPTISTTLSRETAPLDDAHVRPAESRATSRAGSTTDAFARPRSGGAATRSFQASPWRPTTAERPAPGETRRFRRMVRGSMPPG